MYNWLQRHQGAVIITRQGSLHDKCLLPSLQTPAASRMRNRNASLTPDPALSRPREQRCCCLNTVTRRWTCYHTPPSLPNYSSRNVAGSTPFFVHHHHHYTSCNVQPKYVFLLFSFHGDISHFTMVTALDQLITHGLFCWEIILTINRCWKKAQGPRVWWPPDWGLVMDTTR